MKDVLSTAVLLVQFKLDNPFTHLCQIRQCWLLPWRTNSRGTV